MIQQGRWKKDNSGEIIVVQKFMVMEAIFGKKNPLILAFFFFVRGMSKHSYLIKILELFNFY